jgi:uncharacterized protein (TIGR02231 family)
MKKQFLVCTLSLSLFAQVFAVENPEKKVQSAPKEVTLFLSGAQVVNTATISLQSGVTDLVFENIAPNLQENYITAKGEGDFTVLGVTYRMNYLDQETEMPKEVKVLSDSLEGLRNRSELLTATLRLFENEEALLNANRSIGGQNTGVSSAELEKIATLYRTRMTEILGKKFEINSKLKKINEQITRINNQMAELNEQRNKPSGEIVVSVMAKAPVTAKVSVLYFVNGAGWTPYYDIRAEDTDAPVSLEYKAKVWQNSGFDWKDVKLTLSTNNPTLSGSRPVMGIWWLDFYNPNIYSYKQQQMYMNNNTVPAAAASRAPVAMEADKLEEARSVADFTTMTENTISTSFEIKLPYMIPSDNKPHVVDIQKFDVKAEYDYYAAPKLDRDAFLLAKITGWDQYNLLSGEANVFFEGMFVGKSNINTRFTSDTLAISMGRDKNVAITRRKLKDFTEKKVIGTQIKETYSFEITLRNKKKSDIEIDVQDQIPVSQNKELEVELINDSGGQLEASTGYLTWKLKLKKGETKTLKFTFSVRYPKDKSIGNLF